MNYLRPMFPKTICQCFLRQSVTAQQYNLKLKIMKLHTLEFKNSKKINSDEWNPKRI